MLRNGEDISIRLLEPHHPITVRWCPHSELILLQEGKVELLEMDAPVSTRFAVVYLTNLEDLQGRSELAEDIARLILDFKPRQRTP